MKSFLKAAATLTGLATDMDLRAIARQTVAKTTGRWPPLPENLAPAPRAARRAAPQPDRVPAPPVQRERPLLLAAASGLQRDGAPLSQFELLRGLKSRNWDVMAVAPKDGPVRACHETIGVDCIVDDGFATSPSVFSAYERSVGAIAARLSQLAPDLVFANTLDCFPIVDAAHLAGIPSVWNIRESEPWRARLADRNVKIAARALACFDYAHSVVFVAAASEEAWSPFCRQGQASVIYNAPAPFEPPQDKKQLRAQFGWADDDTVILSLGAVCPRKGQEDLVAALNLLPPQTRDKMRAVFVGAPDAAYVNILENLMTPEIRQHCEFMGSVENPLDYLAAADLLVNSSRSEAFPRVFLEAAALRTPIIATPVNGAVERMEHMYSAWFYPVGDHAALAEIIENLRNSEQRRTDLANGAFEALVEKWTFDDMLAAYDRTLKAALESADA